MTDHDATLRERIEAIHRDGGPSQGYFGGEYTESDHCCTACGSHGEYGVEWPCATIRALAATEEDTRTPPGLTLSEDESLLNWRGVNYVRQVPDTLRERIEALRKQYTFSSPGGIAYRPRRVLVDALNAALAATEEGKS